MWQCKADLWAAEQLRLKCWVVRGEVQHWQDTLSGGLGHWERSGKEQTGSVLADGQLPGRLHGLRSSRQETKELDYRVLDIPRKENPSEAAPNKKLVNSGA